MPLDGVYLALHGAMLCEGSDDPEAELLEEVRAIVGKRPIAASYDLHAHLTLRMLKAADITVAYQLYPHDDTFETGQRTAGLLLRTLDGEINPVVSMCTVPAIVPSQKQRTKGATPMAALYRLARSYEADTGALSVSYIATQPWMDVPSLGFSTVAMTDGDSTLSDRIAAEMSRKVWSMRHDFDVDIVSVDDAVRRGLAVAGNPVIMVDAADCVGGGAVGDSVEVLKRVLALAPDASVTTLIVDAETAAEAHRAGVGAEIDVALGNKLDSSYGKPLKARARVERLSNGRFRFRGGVFGNTEAQMGPSALLRIGAGEIVVASFPSYEYAGEQLSALGVHPRELKFVIVKNPMNYQQAFEGAAAFFILDSPGPTTPDLKHIAVPRAGRPMFPFDDDFAVEFKPVRNR
jgi:microcystin degradation protein MlrC